MTNSNGTSAPWRALAKPVLCTITADVHVHPHAQFNTYDEYGNSSRVGWAIAALDKIALHTPPGATMWILGDLLHTKDAVPTEVFKPLAACLDKIKKGGVYTQIIPGNHEKPDNFSDFTTLDWISAAGLGIVRKDVSVQTIGGVAFFTLPWFPSMAEPLNRLREAVRAFAAEDPNRLRVLLGHGTIQGCVSDNGHPIEHAEITAQSAWFAAFNLVFFGDIHKHQQVAPNAWYVGAPLQRTFGERNNEPGFVVIYEDLTWERIPLSGLPLFSYNDEGRSGADVAIDENGDDVIVYTRPSDAAIVQRAGDAMPPARLAVDLRDLRAMAEKYIQAFPPPPGVTPAQALDLFMAAHEGRL